jgi:ribosome-associated toxin RatA of RatAB toxin-antitoxin module
VINHAHRAGGRISARRLFVTGVVVLAGVMPASSFAAPVKPDDRPTVAVREEQGVYFVAATFDVAQAPPIVLAVLTDYEGIPRFMPEIHTSAVLERDIGHVVVAQEAVMRVMMFSKHVHLVLEITEEADTLRFHDRCARSFAHYEGSWRMTEHSGRTEVRYELIAQPSFDVPAFLLKRPLQRHSEQMMEQLQREMTLRAAR